jgi:uncharacterized protein with FMN-binding domain
MYNIPMNSNSSKNNLILLGLLVLVTVSIFIYKSVSKDLNTANTSFVETFPNRASDQVVSSNYKDGTYTAIGDYVSPGGPEQVEVTIVLKGDIVESADFVAKADLPTSKFFQDKFAAGYKEFVVGKNINEVKLDIIAGSSLTPHGFNAAIEKIKAEAQS